jgi:hypothetical protein
LRNDRRLLLEVRVSSGVVAVIVRVDDESHRLVGYPLERCLNLVGQRRVLIVDNHDPVVAHRRANVPARALQHVDVPGHFGDLDLNLAEVLFLSGCKTECK